MKNMIRLALFVLLMGFALIYGQEDDVSKEIDEAEDAFEEMDPLPKVTDYRTMKNGSWSRFEMCTRYWRHKCFDVCGVNKLIPEKCMPIMQKSMDSNLHCIGKKMNTPLGRCKMPASYYPGGGFFGGEGMPPEYLVQMMMKEMKYAMHDPGRCAEGCTMLGYLLCGMPPNCDFIDDKNMQRAQQHCDAMETMAELKGECCMKEEYTKMYMKMGMRAERCFREMGEELMEAMNGTEGMSPTRKKRESPPVETYDDKFMHFMEAKIPQVDVSHLRDFVKKVIEKHRKRTESEVGMRKKREFNEDEFFASIRDEV